MRSRNAYVLFWISHVLCTKAGLQSGFMVLQVDKAAPFCAQAYYKATKHRCLWRNMLFEQRGMF
ncbi:MAG TPA: hypothetical protein DIT76_08425 [Spartobacteria bacterium]|nr:hypothetical protein [Spartobacteria bacterium]